MIYIRNMIGAPFILRFAVLNNVYFVQADTLFQGVIFFGTSCGDNGNFQYFLWDRGNFVTSFYIPVLNDFMAKY